jgi:hypothetical protein
LLASSNGNKRSKEKWQIRRYFRPQLEQLWKTHPALKGVGLSARLGGYVKIDRHKAVGQALEQPIMVDGKPFVPLVRKSFELACELNVLFLRQEPPGTLILQGGDLDNRIKTLFDALKVPEKEDMKVEQLDEPLFPFYCLLENDSLITSFSVETDRLLTKPDYQPNQVYLVVEVNVRVMKLTETNIGFLGE